MKLDKFSQYILETWQGKKPLWVPFWVHGFAIGCVLGAFLTPLALERLFLVSEFAANPINLQQPFFWLQAYALITLFGLWFTYYIWNFVAVWRSAVNAGTIGRAAQLFVLFVAISYWGLMATYAHKLFL